MPCPRSGLRKDVEPPGQEKLDPVKVSEKGGDCRGLIEYTRVGRPVCTQGGRPCVVGVGSHPPHK